MPARLLICYAEQFPGDKCQATHSKWRSIATVKSADVHQLPRLLALLDVSFVDRNGGNQVGSVLQSHSLGLVMHDEGSCLAAITLTSIWQSSASSILMMVGRGCRNALR